MTDAMTDDGAVMEAFKYYLRLADTHRSAAEVFATSEPEPDYEQAFVYARTTAIILEHIPKFPGYQSGLSLEQRSHLTAVGEHILERLAVVLERLPIRKDTETQGPREDPPVMLQDPVQFEIESIDLVDAILRTHARRATLLVQSSVRVSDALDCHELHIRACLEGILDSQTAKQKVLLFEGDRAQSFLDAVQDVLDRGALPGSSSVRAWRLIRKLSVACEKLPSKLFITEIHDCDEHPTFRGGFGDIYRASYNGNTVALKRIRMFTGSDSDSRKSRLQFSREALLWQTLHHPFILPLRGIDREHFPSSFCMVSPWMKHGTVLKYIGERRGDLTKLLLEVSYGLQYLHSMKVVHGDLRGANILITDNGTACLADFGLASAISDSTGSTGALKSSSSHPGSLRWFAPELIFPTQFGFEKFARSYATDIYAYGCVCLELHTRKPPFSDVQENLEAMMKVIKGERPARPMADDSLILNDWWELLTKAWAQDARARPTISDIIESIEKFGKK